MTRKKELFADYMVAGYEKLQAAILAGWSQKTAGVAASRALSDPKVLALIEEKKAAATLEIQQKAQKEAEQNWLSAENIAKGFKAIHDRCMQATPVMRWDAQQRRMVQATDEGGNHVWQFDSNGANRAWENIAKHVGFYELDNTQKTPVIKVQLNQVNNYNGNGEQATGNNGGITDTSLFTLLPSPTDQSDTEPG